MKAITAITSLLFAGLIATTPAAAAEPARTTTQAHVSLSTAERLSAAAQAHARASNFNLVFVVIDASGNTVLVSRMDGTNPLLTEVARRKAVTALIMQQPSGNVADPATLGTVKLMGRAPARQRPGHRRHGRFGRPRRSGRSRCPGRHRRRRSGKLKLDLTAISTGWKTATAAC